MLYSGRMTIKIEDIIFWILIFAIIGIALWLLSGSPTEISAIIAVGIFVASSEIMIWKAFFKNNEKTTIKLEKIDKKTSISFEKVKSRFDKIDIKLENIQDQIKNLNRK